MYKVKFFSDNQKLYSAMLNDIRKAQKYVYLETYIFGNNETGREFKDALIGIKNHNPDIDIKILLDGMGTNAGSRFFRDFKKAGVELSLFRRFKWRWKLLKENNFRNHRKLLIIDDKVCYIGSSNITAQSHDWRESNFRLTGGIVLMMKKVFLDNLAIYRKPYFRKKDHVETLYYEDLEIIRDLPSIKYRRTKQKWLKMIKRARKFIYLEYPYFLPDSRIRRNLYRAARRGADVRVMLPLNSDVRIVDILREKYMGKLHKEGIKIYFYEPRVLHSKYMVADNLFFVLGSSNMDYRSSLFHFEINLFGENLDIAKTLKSNFEKGLKSCRKFDYARWKKRSLLQKSLERLLTPFRILL